MFRHAVLLGVCLLAWPAMGRAEAAGTAASGSGPTGTVTVLYAGSLVNLMERGIGPAFDKASGFTFRGYAGGSNGLAHQIAGRLRRGDVFISANPKVNEDLTGAAHGDWIRWYAVFARSPLVIGYNPASRFAADFKTKPWYAVLAEPGIRIGRTDPKLDPKGKLTVQLLDHAERLYKQPGLARNVLGAPDNPAQVLPEETLVGEMQSGQLDAGFFYSTETSDLHIATIPLPPEVALGARYTVTILRDAPNEGGAVRFVAFLLGPEGTSILRAHGLDVTPPALSGDDDAVPAALRGMIGGNRGGSAGEAK